MGFDLLLAGGAQNTIFADDLLACLVEVRVEQKLDEPTKFAVRFQDDIDDGQLMKSRLPELRIGQLLTVAVRRGDGYACLVRGPILETKQEMTLGGPGSWYEVHGLDRRDELARAFREGAWSGRASDVATQLLSEVYPGPMVDPTTEVHDQEGRHLPQRGTDLEFLTKNAAESGYHFWITYEDVAATPSRRIVLREVAHWQASPPLQDSPAIGLPPVLPLSDDSITLRYNVPQSQCPNLTKFELSRDGSRPTDVRASTRNTADGNTDAVTVQDEAAPLGGQGRGLSDVAPVRFMPPRPQGDAQTARDVNAAALREAGFFVKADVSTTRYLLGSVLEPHQIVAVEGLGRPNGDVPFRVAEVTHVINGIAHFMDAKLETNTELAA